MGTTSYLSEIKTHPMRKIALLLFILVAGIQSSLIAQLTESEVKQYNKSLKLYNKGKHDKAIAMLTKIQYGNIQNEDLWDVRVQMEYGRYIKQLNTDITTAEKKFSSTREQNNYINNGKSAQYEIELLAACSQATLYCEKQERASMLLRILMVDKGEGKPDKEAKEEYDKGEEKFAAKDFTGAIRCYKKAVDIDSTYYKATLYLGDAYFNNEDYDKALIWYKKACDMRPNLLEPRKYLTDAHMKQKNWKEAYNACIEGIAVYPDVGMFIKLEEICDKLGKTFDRHWVSRMNYPNSNGAVQEPIETAPWSYYRQAKTEIKFYCNQDGIITEETEKTKSKFMEVYSWEFMLEKGQGSELTFARKMNEAGFLDCYVFISMYHISFHQQFAKWSEDNKERVKTYIDTYLVK